MQVPLQPFVVRDYVYDIGPESCLNLTEEIEQADLLFVWGTVGQITDTCGVVWCGVLCCAVPYCTIYDCVVLDKK
jgi:hypothetical protein